MNYEEIKKLIDDMGNAKIDELEIEFPEGMKISMKKNAEKEIILKNISDMKQQNFIPETTNMQLDNQSIIKSDVKENISYMYDEEFAKDENEYPYQVINDKESINKILKLYVEKYYNENDDKQTWFNKIKELSGEMGYAKEVKEFKANPGMYAAHVGDVSTVLRVALTKRTNTPDLYEIMQVLGKDEIVRRFSK